MPRSTIHGALKRKTVSVDPEDYERLEQLAANSSLSTAFLIRQAMREFLQQHGEGDSVSVEIKSA